MDCFVTERLKEPTASPAVEDAAAKVTLGIRNMSQDTMSMTLQPHRKMAIMVN